MVIGLNNGGYEDLLGTAMLTGIKVKMPHMLALKLLTDFADVWTLGYYVLEIVNPYSYTFQDATSREREPRYNP